MQNENQGHPFKWMSKKHHLKNALGLYSKVETKLKNYSSFQLMTDVNI